MRITKLVPMRRETVSLKTSLNGHFFLKKDLGVGGRGFPGSPVVKSSPMLDPGRCWIPVGEIPRAPRVTKLMHHNH